MNVRTSLLIAGVALVLAGCASTPSSRIQADRAAYDSYPLAVQEKIATGEVEVGFTREQVTMALGKADRVTRRTTPDGTSEVWSYRDRGPRFSVGLGVGVGSGGGSTRVGTGVGVTTGDRDWADERMRVVFDPNGQVSAVETMQRR